MKGVDIRNTERIVLETSTREDTGNTTIKLIL
jgi:hypothetical protein